METRIERPANSFGIPRRDALRPTESIPFEPPTVEEISLCCEISAYAPDGDDRPLF